MLATQILKNNSCGFRFLHKDTVLDERYSVGVLYDIRDPDVLPWELVLYKLDDCERRKAHEIHINALKHAEYVEIGNINVVNNMSRHDHVRLVRDLTMEKYDNPFMYREVPNERPIATRVHFSDGNSLIICNRPDVSVFGIVQGLLISKSRAGDLRMLKDVDNWLHICFPNAAASSTETNDRNGGNGGNNSNKIVVTFRSVAATPLIKENVVRFPKLTTIKQCRQYIERRLGAQYDGRKLFLYVDGMFLAEEDESLLNIAMDKSWTTLYYSTVEAWT
jgi:hypothetical protein